MRSTALLLLACCLAQAAPPALARSPRQAPAVEPPATAPQAAGVTVGEFALRLAAALRLPPPPSGLTAESAAWALLQRGVTLRPDLSSPLTEADAVVVLGGLGYRVRTETPSRVMTADRVSLLIETFIASPK